MNVAHWHLMLNHLPIIGTVIGAAILAAGYLFKTRPDIKRTALAVFLFAAVFAIPAFLTGEGAEEAVENIPGVTKDRIESHEDLGKLFFIVVEVLGFLALITFLADWKKSNLTRLLYMVVLVLSAGISIFARQLATSGGEIRHSEIQAGAPATSESGNENEEEKD